MSKHYLHEGESTKCYVKGKCLFFGIDNSSDKKQPILDLRLPQGIVEARYCISLDQFKSPHIFVLDKHISKKHCNIVLSVTLGISFTMRIYRQHHESHTCCIFCFDKNIVQNA